MSTMTPIGNRLQTTLDAEYLRMENEWFFKWHHIGRDDVIEIDGFDGRMIRYGGIKFSDTARSVYWETIQRYARQKVAQLFNELEAELQKYPLDIRSKALDESRSLIAVFFGKIRKATVEKDRILRGNGFEFPDQQDLGNWNGTQAFDIESRIATLRHIYCDLQVAEGGDIMSFKRTLRDKVTLVKANGAVARQDIQAQVSAGQIITLDADLQIEPGDHFLRSLPSGLVEDYLIEDPNFITGIGSIPSSFQSKVSRSQEAVARSNQIIQRITNNFNGDNSRVTFGTDNSINTANQLSPFAVANLIEQIKPHVNLLPERPRTEIAAPLKLLEDEIRSDSVDPSKVTGALRSILTIVEGTTSNLIASGIEAMIRKML